MDLTEWEPIYKQILTDFGFSRADDERSALILSELLKAKGCCDASLERLERIIEGQNVIICGKAPTLIQDIMGGKIEADEVIIAADGATSVLLSQGVIPKIIVSDLDGKIEHLRAANIMCATMVVHAHGDNVDKLRAYIPALSDVLGTTQSQPLPNVLNVGGFTDGDRAIFLAQAFGARRISAIGFDFSDASATPQKLKKLKWAKRLLERTEVNFK